MTYIITIILVAFSGLFSGLNLGLLSLNPSELERKIKLGDKNAAKIYPVRKRGNLLLCTLLLGNVAVNSALAIFLGDIASGLIAGIISTALIVIFGEIIPQAACARYALPVGAKTIWLVKIFIFILYPITWPLSKTLDKILGNELPTVWSKQELAEIVKMHEDSPRSDVDSDEEKILLGALTFSDKTAKDIMTPQPIAFRLELNDTINQATRNEIKEKGFTRIPVYEKNVNNIIGILYSKDLINISGEVKVKDIYRHNSLLIVSPETKLDELLNKLVLARNHIAFVFDQYGTFDGIVTLEDVLEEVIGTEIVDEADTVVDLRKEAIDRAQKRFQK